MGANESQVIPTLFHALDLYESKGVMALLLFLDDKSGSDSGRFFARGLSAFLKGIFTVKYELGRKPTKSQVFAQKICYIAVSDWDFPIEVISPSALEHLADEARRRFPKACDARFRQMAIGRVRVFQRSCKRQKV